MGASAAAGVFIGGEPSAPGVADGGVCGAAVEVAAGVALGVAPVVGVPDDAQADIRTATTRHNKPKTVLLTLSLKSLRISKRSPQSYFFSYFFHISSMAWISVRLVHLWPMAAQI
jgi:hypothetical protein